jgi:hypothetical protein
MLRLISCAVFGLALVAFAQPASAAWPSDDKAPQAVTVAATEVPAIEPVSDVAAAAPRERDRARPKRSEVRGARRGGSDLNFHNPYAFPIQSLPVMIPIVGPFGF